jgi:hypothetical protein
VVLRTGHTTRANEHKIGPSPTRAGTTGAGLIRVLTESSVRAPNVDYRTTKTPATAIGGLAQGRHSDQLGHTNVPFGHVR